MGNLWHSLTSTCDRRHSVSIRGRLQVIQTETHVLTPENCPAPLQDPKSRCLSGEPGTFQASELVFLKVPAVGAPAIRTRRFLSAVSALTRCSLSHTPQLKTTPALSA